MAQDALRAIKAHKLGATDRRLILAHARLLLALDRLEPAWNALGPLVLALEPEPEELLVGARILKRRHGLRGDPELVGQAADLAEAHFEVTGEVGSAFLAWQCARRAGRPEAAAALAEKLTTQFGTTPEGRFVAALANEATTLGDLEKLEIDFADQSGPLDRALAPEEVDFAIAFLLLRAGDKERIQDAIRRLETVLRTLSADPDARHLLALALHEAGDAKRRDLHLDWLLENAPAADERRAVWEATKGQPAAGQ